MDQRHYHCYEWIGFGPDLDDEALRRPQPDEYFDTRFRKSPLPPLVLHHWLYKRPVKTFTDPLDAEEWILNKYDSVKDRFLAPDLIGVAYRDLRTRESLAKWRDVCWQFWLLHAQYASFYIIVCPNYYAQLVGEALPCPKR